MISCLSHAQDKFEMVYKTDLGQMLIHGQMKNKSAILNPEGILFGDPIADKQPLHADCTATTFYLPL